MENEILEKELTGKIIKAFYNVYNTLGYGFLEKVYERAMVIELNKFGLKSERQKPINVLYDNANKIMNELKDFKTTSIKPPT